MNQREQRTNCGAFVPVIEGATEQRLALEKGDRRAQDDRHPEQGGEAACKADAAEGCKGDEQCDADGKARVAVGLTVSDNGPGFSARILTRAFEPYVTTKAKGTGLGLAMVKKIVDEHGARIDIRKRLKAGDVIEGAQISILFLQLADNAAPGSGSQGAQTGSQTARSGASQGTTKATVQTRAA